MTDEMEVDCINNEQYFKYLLETYERLIYSICYKAIGNQMDAEDLTQETYLSIYKNLSTFDRCYEKAWVCKIASNKCLDFVKSASRRSLATEQEYFIEMKDEKATPEEEYFHKESRQNVYAICQQLKDPYREVATAHFYNDESAREIADKRGKNLKTIQTQIYRAKGMLKKIIERSG
jgi:RNA polymerase sigma-70 factor (ECF subfamily)